MPAQPALTTEWIATDGAQTTISLNIRVEKKEAELVLDENPTASELTGLIFWDTLKQRLAEALTQEPESLVRET